MQFEKVKDWLDKVIENRKELDSLANVFENISLGYITDNEILLSKGIEYIASALGVPLTYGEPFPSYRETTMKRKISFFYNGFVFSSFIYADGDGNEEKQ